MIPTKPWKTGGTFCQPLSTNPGSSEVSDRAAPLQLTRIQGLRRCIPAGRTLVNRDNKEFTWTWAGEPCRCSRGFLITVNPEFRFQIRCVLKWRNTSATCYNDKQLSDVSWNYFPRNQQKQHLKGSLLIGISKACRYATKPQNPFPPE